MNLFNFFLYLIKFCRNVAFVKILQFIRVAKVKAKIIVNYVHAQSLIFEYYACHLPLEQFKLSFKLSQPICSSLAFWQLCITLHIYSQRRLFYYIVWWIWIYGIFFLETLQNKLLQWLKLKTASFQVVLRKKYKKKKINP